MIVNNQVGFTATSTQGRSSHYSADVAKMISAPTIHVNSDSVEVRILAYSLQIIAFLIVSHQDVVKAARLVAEYRNKFKKDIVLDLIGYRRHGHNEVDEPSFTQPKMYLTKYIRQVTMFYT